MALTQRDIAYQMIRQLRILDPAVSADLGTPERKIIDTVAQSLADAQVDLTILSSALDVDSKVGSDLDRFLSLFGFARQAGTPSTGVVEFSRITASTSDIPIPAGTQIAAQTSDGFNRAVFATTSRTVLQAGETIVFAPIRSVNTGAYNNISANRVTIFVGDPLLGITGVTNPTPTIGGKDAETDNELKVRFRNTLFRNVAGTEDQFLALAVAGAFTNKAIVVGPISRYREYIQVPAVDDASIDDVNGDGNPESGNGAAGEYTTALSTIPYSEYTYREIPTFVSDGQMGPQATFFTEGVDFDFNYAPDMKYKGDTYRLAKAGNGANPLSDEEAAFQPNLTFLNVFTGAETGVDAVRPGDILLAEHSYVSSASRNDYERHVTNCVDVYINGDNQTRAVTNTPRPSTLVNQFVNDPANRYHFENYRRMGEPEHRPVLGNVFTPLFWNPMVSLPATIIAGATTYTQGVHFWPISDVSDLRGTVRARTGIEWSVDAKGDGPGTLNITANPAEAVKVQYFYDKNVMDIQAGIEGSKQVTTDVLVHKATTRYFKFDITVMYQEGSSKEATNASIRSSLQGWLGSRYFGTVVQLSDVLQVIHNVTGVDNVRWSNEISPALDKVTETTLNGTPRLGIIVDRFVTGTVVTQEEQRFYLTGDADAGTYKIKHGVNTTANIPFGAGYSEVNSKVQAASIPGTVVGGTGAPDNPFRLVFDTAGVRALIEPQTAGLQGGPRVFNDDFFLRDNELPSLAGGVQPGDTVAGLIIRARAQNTWKRS